MVGHPTAVEVIMEVEGIYVQVNKVFIIINIATRSSVLITTKSISTKKLLHETLPMMRYP